MIASHAGRSAGSLFFFFLCHSLLGNSFSILKPLFSPSEKSDKTSYCTVLSHLSPGSREMKSNTAALLFIFVLSFQV